MSAGEQAAEMLRKLAATARTMRESEKHWPQMAANPTHRKHLEDAVAHFDSHLSELHHTARESQKCRDALVKVLRRVRPRIAA